VLPSILSKVTLRAQLAILFCIALLPGFVLLFWLRGEVRELQAQDIAQRATQLAQLVAETQISRTQGVEQLIATFASVPVVRDGDTRACSAFFHDLLRTSSTGYLNFGLLDTSGRVRCTAVGEPGSNLADNPAFKRAMTTDQLTITPIGRGRLIGRDVFSYMRRIGADGQPPAVVFVGFGLDTVAAALARVPLPADASLALMTATGDVVAAYPAEGEAPMHRVQQHIATLAPMANSVFSAEGDDGVTRSFAAVRLTPPDALVAVAALPAAGTALADDRFLAAVLVFGACSLITLIVALVMANRGIRAPIQQLLDAMAQVRQGHFDARADLVRASPEVRGLAQGFDEMTAQLAAREQRTRQAQRLEAVGQLAGGIAHDFNNMLTAIIGFGEELRDHVRPEGRGHLEEVLQAGTRAKDLTQQLLAFSRRQVLRAEPVQLTRTVEELSRMLQRIIGEHVRLDLQLTPNLPLIRADRTQLDQVITNLVVNARDAMATGGILTLKTDRLTSSALDPERPDLPAGRYARLTVTDTGHGMDAETMAHVFEPFFTTKEFGQGTGLGLATVYGVVRQSGGHVLVHSRPGGGTTFEVCFPVVDDAEAPPPPPPAPERQPSRTGETILVVEDEASVRRLAVTVLRRAGYTVLEAGDVPAAMRVAADAPTIDLLLTDIVLPGPSGISLGRSLKQLRPGLAVLHMSGYSAELSSAATAEERSSFLGKPFTPAALLKAVHDALGYRVAAATGG
jgi:signal transduction histidine kinase/ActR/RegA family two-component response regulator